LFSGDSFVVNQGRYDGLLNNNDVLLDMAAIDGVEKLGASSVLRMEAVFSTEGRSGFVFDQYSATDFKWVAIDVVSQEVLLGHTKGNNWTIDASVARSDLIAGVDAKLGITLSGTTVSVTLNGQAALGFGFNGNTVDGRFGIFTSNGNASFDSVTIQTNDPAFETEAEMLWAATAPSEPATSIDALTFDLLQPVVDEAIRRLSGSLDPVQVVALKQLKIEIVDLEGLLLGSYKDGVIYLDYNAAGHGWFIDPTPGNDVEYRFDGDVLEAKSSQAVDKIDLLSVLMHEFGHALGMEHTDDGVMSEDLNAGVRLTDLDGSSSIETVSRAESPRIDWEGLLAGTDRREDVAKTQGSRDWITEFVNYVGDNQKTLNPNASLKVHVEINSEALPEVNTLNRKIK
jgi:hypothetical protein